MSLAAVRQDGCPQGLCDGSGWRWFDDDGRPASEEDGTGARQCECVHEQLRHRRAARVREALPSNLQHVGLDRWPVTNMPAEHVEPVRAYIDQLDANVESGAGLWLSGPPGTGKSTLAASVYLRAAADHTVAFWRFSQLLKRIRLTSYGDDGRMSDVEWEARLREVDLLVLDDVGAEKASEWVINEAYEILADREGASLPVIVTTNLPQPDLEEHIGPRVVSRLYAVAGEPIAIEGQDHRKERAREKAGLAVLPGGEA